MGGWGNGTAHRSAHMLDKHSAILTTLFSTWRQGFNSQPRLALNSLCNPGRLCKAIFLLLPPSQLRLQSVSSGPVLKQPRVSNIPDWLPICCLGDYGLESLILPTTGNLGVCTAVPGVCSAGGQTHGCLYVRQTFYQLRYICLYPFKLFWKRKCPVILLIDFFLCSFFFTLYFLLRFICIVGCWWCKPGGGGTYL